MANTREQTMATTTDCTTEQAKAGQCLQCFGKIKQEINLRIMKNCLPGKEKCALIDCGQMDSGQSLVSGAKCHKAITSAQKESVAMRISYHCHGSIVATTNADDHIIGPPFSW